MKFVFVALFTAALVGCQSQAGGVSTGQAAPDFTLTDSNGQTHSLSDFKGQLVVLEWTNDGCPFVVKHYKSRNMQTLQETYTSKDVIWLSICSSAPGKQGHKNGQAWNQQLRNDQSKATALLLDEDGKVGRMYGAKVTPHVFVINTEGTLIYQGAIDSIKSWKAEDIPKAENYIASALDSAMAGEKVAVSDTPPYGCGVKY